MLFRMDFNQTYNWKVMKKITILMLLFCGFFINDARASCFQGDDIECNNQGPYLGIMGGIVVLDINMKHDTQEFKPGYYLEGYFGYRFSRKLRLEGELSYHRAEIDRFTNSIRGDHFKKAQGNVRILSYMINGLCEFNLNFPLKPYVGIGIGYAQGRGSWKGKMSYDIHDFFFNERVLVSTTVKYKKDGFAWQPIVGISYQVCNNFEASLDYRFLSIDNDVSTHKVGVSLTGRF